MEIKKLEVKQVDEITNLVWNVMEDAKQLPTYADYNPEKGKKLLHYMIRKDMERDFLLCYGALEEETLIGMVGYEPIRNEISYLYVLPAYQRKGIGSKLLDVIIHGIMDTPSVILRAHKDAVPMYEKYGFKKNGDDSPFSIGMEYVLRRK